MPNMLKYTEEHINYLKEIAPGRHIDEIVKLFNKRFDMNTTKTRLASLKKRFGIRSGIKGGCPLEQQKRLTTPEQDEYIKSIAYGKSGVELQRIFKEKFGIELSLPQIKSYKARKKINTGLTGYFEKGHVSHNKGKKLSKEIYEKIAPTMFRAGNRPHNAAPVGTEIITSDGYVRVKIAEPNKWQAKHVIVWEATNGKRPRGHKIIFLDGDKMNTTIENLACVSDAELARMNQGHLLSENAEVTKAGVLQARLITRIADLKKVKDEAHCTV